MVQVSWLNTLQSKFNLALLRAELLSDLINVAPVDHPHLPTFLAEKEVSNWRLKTYKTPLPLQCYEGEDEGVLPNGADDEEDADKHELVQAGLHAPGRGPVEQVDADQEEDHQE